MVQKMYTVDISDYKNFRQNAVYGKILHESVEFSTNFDEFLDECVVNDNYNLKYIHESILRAIVVRLWNDSVIVEKECFILSVNNDVFPMFIRAVEKENSIHVEFDDFNYSVTICRI